MAPCFFGKKLLAAGVLAGAVSAHGARAELLQFSFVSGTEGASWQQSSNPTILSGTQFGFFVSVQNGAENTKFYGMDTFTQVGYTIASRGGGFDTQPGEVITFGPAIFAGTVTAPTFSPGVFNLNFDNSEGRLVPGVLTITDIVEPTSLALLGSAVTGMILAAGYRRRTASGSRRA